MVWEADDLVTSRKVAVKILQTHLLASSAARRRFRREVEAAGTLRHPHSVEVLAHGETAGQAYLVMERLRGVTLASRLRSSGPLPQLRAIEIAAQILDAAAAAHRVFIVHRDLKPANVMLIDRDGNPDFVKVCDFGLAKAIEPDRLNSTYASDNPDLGGDFADGDAGSTARGIVCGTPEYMAPEQARGDVIDGRADLYSVAATLYHAIVGQVPFRGRSPLAVIAKHLNDPPLRPSVVRPDLGIFPPLEALILRGLAKDRAERPSSAEVFSADLLQIKRDYLRSLRKSRDLVTTTTGPAAETFRGTAPRRPARSAVRDAALIGAATLTVAGLLLLTGKLRPARDHHLSSGPVRAAMQARRDETASPLTSADQAQPPPSVLEAESTAGFGDSPPRRRVRQQHAAAGVGTDAAKLLLPAEERLAHGQIAEACELGQIAAARAPRVATVWEFLGGCYMRMALPEDARAYYRKALALAPDGPKAGFVRAMLGQETP